MFPVDRLRSLLKICRVRSSGEQVFRMNDNGKRDTAKANDSPAKKPRQMSLLSMFKPAVDPKPKSDKDNVAALAVTNPRDWFPTADAATLDLLDLELKGIDLEWLKALKGELTKPSFLALKRFLKQEAAAGKTVYPPPDQIYSWSRYTPPSRVKVVILGQDPYHNVNQAHGLCFSVRKGVATPPSLVNIYEAVQRDYPDFKKPKHGFLENWAKQGVLMLNTSLTVRAHEAASHANKGWEPFTDAVIKHLNEKRSNIVFMLWGSHAQKKGSTIDKKKHLVLKSVHPSPLSAYRGFMDCQHFKKANEYLMDNGRDKIEWNCLVEGDSKDA